MKSTLKKTKQNKSKSPSQKPFPTLSSTSADSNLHSIDIDQCNSTPNPLPLSSPINPPTPVASQVKQPQPIHQIDIIDFEFRPKKTKVPLNSIVKWVIGENKAIHESGIYSSTTRNFVLIINTLDIESDQLVKGESFEHCFNEIGVYEIGCSNYPRMRGKIEVYEEGKDDLDSPEELEYKRRGLYKTRREFEEGFEDKQRKKLSVSTGEKNKVKGVHPLIEHFPSYNPHDLQTLIDELHAQDLSQSKSGYKEQQKEKEKASNVVDQLYVNENEPKCLDSTENSPEMGYDEYSSYSDYDYDKANEFELSYILKGRKVSSPMTLPPIYEEQKTVESQAITIFAMESVLLEKEAKEERLIENECKRENINEDKIEEHNERSIDKDDVEKDMQEGQGEKEKKKKKKSKNKKKKKKKKNHPEDHENDSKDVSNADDKNANLNSSISGNRKEEATTNETKSVAAFNGNEAQKPNTTTAMNNIDTTKSEPEIIEKTKKSYREEVKNVYKTIQLEKSMANITRNGYKQKEAEYINKNKEAKTPTKPQSFEKPKADKEIVSMHNADASTNQKVEERSKITQHNKSEVVISKSDEFFAFIKKSANEYINKNKKSFFSNKKYKNTTTKDAHEDEEAEKVAMLKAFLLNRFEYSETFN